MFDRSELVITGTLFPHKTIHKVMWDSPGGNAMNQIDHVLISRRFRNSVKDTRVCRSADIESDNHLLCTALKLRKTKQTTEKKRCRVKYDTAKLRNEEVLRRFNIALQNRYQVVDNKETAVEENEEVEQDFQVMKKAYTEVAESVLGRPRQKKPWISEESWSLIDQREELNKNFLGTRSERVKKQLGTKYVEKNREVKRSMRTDKKKWMENITSEAEEAARNQHMKTLYGLTKILCNEKPKQSTAVLDKNGNLNKKEEVQTRWMEHFKEVLNRGESENPALSDEVYESKLGDIIEEILVSEPTLREVKQAIKRLKNGKASGTDSIMAELLKANVDFSATS